MLLEIKSNNVILTYSFNDGKVFFFAGNTGHAAAALVV